MEALEGMATTAENLVGMGPPVVEDVAERVAEATAGVVVEEEAALRSHPRPRCRSGLRLSDTPRARPPETPHQRLYPQNLQRLGRERQQTNQAQLQAAAAPSVAAGKAAAK